MPDDSFDYGSYISSNINWDAKKAETVVIDSEEFRELLLRLYQHLAKMADNVNLSEKGYYPLFDFVTGNQFFPNATEDTIYRSVYRKTINFGALPNTGAKSVAHGITFTARSSVTKIYGAASDTTGFNYIPLPFASPILANNISVEVDATNVTVTTGSNRTNFNICYIIIEYMQQ